MSAQTVAKQIDYLKTNYLPTDIVVMHLWAGGDVVSRSDELGYSHQWEDEDTIWVLDQLDDNMESETGISWGICDEYVRQRAEAQGYVEVFDMPEEE